MPPEGDYRTQLPYTDVSGNFTRVLVVDDEPANVELLEAPLEPEGFKVLTIMVLTAKELTDADKAALNGHVAAIFQRNSLAGSELVEWLRGFVATGLAA